MFCLNRLLFDDSFEFDIEIEELYGFIKSLPDTFVATLEIFWKHIVSVRHETKYNQQTFLL